MQHHTLGVANFLIHQKFLDIRSLIPTQLNDFTHFLILLNGSVARKVLFESLANALHVQIIGQTRHRRNTFATVALLDSDVHLFFRLHAALVSGVFKGVCFGELVIARDQQKDDETVF